jgi:hypothetical protein
VIVRAAASAALCRLAFGAALAVAGARLAATDATALELSIPEIEIPAGATVEAPVKSADARGLAALQISVRFDGAAFEVGGVRGGPALSNALVDFRAGAGVCNVAVAGSQPIAEDGDVLMIAFRRKGGSTAGSIVDLTDAQAWTADGEAMTVAIRSGAIAALAARPGSGSR